MKKVILLFAIAIFSASTFANTNTFGPKEIKEELRKEIVKLLGNVNFELKEDVTTNVEFMINKKGEIVILDVNSTNPNIAHYVKSRLNYKNIHNNTAKRLTVYKMPLRIKN